jgi:hypothetical protein
MSILLVVTVNASILDQRVSSERARAQTAEIQAQATTTAPPKARLTHPTWFPDAMPAKPAKK